VNKRLRLAVRNAVCTDCALSRELAGLDVCVTGSGPNDATIGVVTTFPLREDSRLKRELTEYLTGVGIDTDSVMWLSALKCAPPEGMPTKTHMKACRPYLQAEFANLSLTHVITFGSEALFAALGRSGVMKYRGRVEMVGPIVVFPTISPSMIARNPGMKGGFLADLRYFANTVKDLGGEDPWHLPYDDQWTDVNDKDGLRSLVRALKAADAVAYDIETTGGSAFDSEARIVSLALTTLTGDTPHVWTIPLFHPESPWRDKWERVLEILARWLCRVPKRIGHNAKYDTVWLNHFGMPELTPTFDTIIAAALLDENRPKGLKPLAQQLLGADPWGIDTRNLLSTPLAQILPYNGLDTWHTLRLWLLFRSQLAAEPRVGRLFARLMMPAVQELGRVEARGVYVDEALMLANWAIVQKRLADIESELSSYLPDPSEVPDRLKHKRTGEVLVNFNASHFLRWWLFEYLGMPVLARGKAKESGAPGDPSVAESVMMALAEQDNPVAKLMLERVEWNKYHTAFFTPYAAQITDDSRIRTTFKPWGTVTGRLSSGKEDVEKVTGTAKSAMRGVNLQQVPRNKLVRGVFGAAPGWLFVEADYSQIELRIAAFIAQEPTMLQLYAQGQDIHMAMAMRMTGKPASQVTSEERKKAKAVNFGFLYGMGWRKFILTAFANYGLHVTEEESQAFRKSFFAQFPQLQAWHARQRSLAIRYGRVETPMGRVRHLPDIESGNPEVRAEAERQAINSPVQGMASDMALLSLVHTSRAFRKLGLEAYAIGTVHDAVNFEVRQDHVSMALPVIKHTMENLPLERLFGCHVNVPIVADLKVGTHWGGATEVPPDILAGPPGLMRKWLTENRLLT